MEWNWLHFHWRSSKNEVDKKDIEKITIISPAGSSEDMETLMMDPITNHIYILTKNHKEAVARIYKVNMSTNFYSLQYS